jgi:circadian clock protein KaiB
LKFDKPPLPQLFKGIAVFTPGGDLIYCIDPTKQGHWHMDLCVSLQEMLGLPEPPHFLVPGYTATIDRWLDPQTRQLRTSAELYRPVLQHQALLNALFGMADFVWQVAPWEEESCDPIVLETYRHQFPQLWEDHDLIVRFNRPHVFSYAQRADYVNPDVNKGNLQLGSDSQEIDPNSQLSTANSYVLRLFVSGHSTATEEILKSLHELLEHSLHHPYTLKVIDIFKHPEQAEANQISATPTLLRVWPQPVRRIVGDLTNTERVLRILIAPDA